MFRWRNYNLTSPSKTVRMELHPTQVVRRITASRLLIVDDDPLFRRFVLAALQESSFARLDVVAAGSVAEAVEAVGGAAPDCILLDLGLPDSQGIDTVRKILAHAPGIPIVVLTGEAEEEALASLALEAGVQDFIEKRHMEPQTLGRAIQHALDRARWLVEIERKNEELRQRNRDLDDFAHAVSHDLKAPLRAAFHLIEEAQTHLESGDINNTRLVLDSVPDRIRRLFEMIDGILRLTRAGRSGKLAPVQVGESVRQVLSILEIPATFHVNISPELPTVDAEQVALEQVFQNLIDNAIKHHPGPQGEIQIYAHDLGGQWEFVVADDGAGIPAHQRTRVFEVFHTVGPKRRGSTGVGLALVRKIVHANGGKIEARGNGPKGTQMAFTWPKKPQ